MSEKVLTVRFYKTPSVNEPVREWEKTWSCCMA